MTPTVSDMIIEPPEVFKEGGRYGIKIKAQAPSLHIFSAGVNTEVSPVIAVSYTHLYFRHGSCTTRGNYFDSSAYF